MNPTEVKKGDADIDTILQAIQKISGAAIAIEPPKDAASVLCPISTDIKKARKETIKILTIGHLIPNQGIYLGRYEPVDREGVSLGKVFNVFAAPEDLPKKMTYFDTIKYVTKLEKWHGYDGTHYTTDQEIYAALKVGSYHGGWIIPPRELLVGTEPDGDEGIRQGKVIQPDNLFDHQNILAENSKPLLNFYWSSTEDKHYKSGMYVVNFSDGYESWLTKDGGFLSCRPVRLVEITTP